MKRFLPDALAAPSVGAQAEEERFGVHGQSSGIGQRKAPMNAPCSGPNGLGGLTKGEMQNARLSQVHGDQAELEHPHTLNSQPGALRRLAFNTSAPCR